MARRLAAILAVLVLPTTADAELIYVDYEGAVTEIWRNGRNDVVDEYLTRYSIGDRLSGSLIYDTELARPPTARTLAYTGLNSDFVRGFTTLPLDPATGGRTGGRFSDSVSFFDQGYREGFFVGDGGRTCLCGETLDGLHLGLSVYKPDGLLSSDTLRQSFVAEPAKDDSTAFGEIWKRVGNVLGFVGLSLTRISVTPGACRR